MRVPSVGLFTEIYHPVRNGVVASVDTLARSLVRNGNIVTIVTPRLPPYRDDAADAHVMRLRSLPLPFQTRTAYRLTIPYLDAPARRRLRELSIVHAHSPFLTGLLAATLARRRSIPLVFTYHTQLEAYAHYVPFEPHATRFAARSITKHFANLADAVIVPTHAMQTLLRDAGVRVPIWVVPTGIDLAAFRAARGEAFRATHGEAFRATHGIARDARVVLFAGRLGREKNIECVIAAFAKLRLPDARLVLCGDGPQRAQLERDARRAGIAERTIFTGELAREDMPQVYAAANAFAFASTSETQGLVLVEALAAGLPIVAADVPQAREVLDGAGEFVSTDPLGMSRALERALTGDAGSAAARFEREKRAVVASRFAAEHQAARVSELYSALLSARPVPVRSEAAFAGVN